MNTYIHHFSCSDCGPFEVKCTKEKIPVPGCPSCGEGFSAKKGRTSQRGKGRTAKRKKQDFEDMLRDRKAPASIGKSKSKIIDQTAEMVMKDYGMTDINMGSGLREGDTCAPKLPPDQQKRADNFFTPQKSKKLPYNPGALAAKAMAGGFRSSVDPVGALHSGKSGN